MEKTNQPQSHNFVSEVKNAIDIVSLIEKSVSLHILDSEWYAGATSTGSQSGESLKVNSREQYYINWATGNKGDAFNWIAYDKNLDIKKDFRQILTIAAEEAGIPMEQMSPEEHEKIQTFYEIQDTLTQAAEIYHNNLTPELREYINKKWGINNETIDTLKIGYARPEDDLKGKIDFKLLKQSGLLVKVGDYFNEHFVGRITFPYWINGKVVNFAARGDKDNLGTPELLHEMAKYKKLLVHSEKHSYVHEAANNRYLFGEDSLRGKEFCIITEGIADSIVLLQNGYPVISPVTVQFSDKDNEKLVHAVKRLEKVYICNDNEESKAGEKGAIITGRLLKREGVNVFIVTLPREEGVSKVDVAEYFLKHDKADFEEVLNQSLHLFKYLLKEIKPSDDKRDNLE